MLQNTLSPNGGVTRGVCEVADDIVVDVVETHEIVQTTDGAESNGTAIAMDALVSMNMWGFTPKFVDLLEKGFEEFFDHMANPMKDEYLLPIYIGELLQRKAVSMKVLKTSDRWFGVTYREDRQSVT